MIFKNSLLSITNSLLQLVTSLVSGIIIARLLGVEGKGLVFLITQVFGILQLVFSFGFGPSILYGLKNSRVSKPKVHYFLLGYLLLVLFLFSIVIVFFPEVVDRIFGVSLNMRFMIITFVIAFLNVISSIFGFELMVSDNGITKNVLISTISNFCYLLLVIFLLLILKGGVLSVLVSLLIAALGKTFLTLFFVFNQECRIEKPCKKEVIALAFHGAQFFLNAFFLNSIFRLDIFFLSQYSKLDDIGYYSVSVNVAELILIIPSAIGAILFPHLTGLDRAEQRQKMAQSGRINFTIGVFGSIFLASIGYFFILIVFGRNFLPAFGPLLILLPGIVAMTLNYSYSNYISSIGKPMTGTIFFGLGMILNIIMNYYLIPQYGMWAAAFSSSVTYLYITFLFVIYIRKIDKIKVKDFMLPRISDVFHIYYKFYKDVIKAK